MGPKNKDPPIIPKGSSEVRVPALISLSWNLVISDGRMEPRVIITTPKRNMPMHAAEKTLVKLN